MRRLMSVGLLALALPTAALANSIDFNIGTFRHGSVSNPEFETPPPEVITLVGTEATIRLHIPVLIVGTGFANCASFGSHCTFPDATIQIFNHLGGLIFTASLSNGTLAHHFHSSAEPNDADILAHIVPSSCTGMNGIPIDCAGGTVALDNLSIRGVNIRGVDVKGAAHIVLIPEPGTLGMLGTGLIGLAGIAKRKLKLWT